MIRNLPSTVETNATPPITRSKKRNPIPNKLPDAHDVVGLALMMTARTMTTATIAPAVLLEVTTPLPEIGR